MGTSARATAQTPLLTHLGDPLLATWQYGLGRSVAWTSDATGRWGQDWVRWEGFATFWNQTVRWSFGARPAGGLESRVTLDGDTARLTVDAQRDGQFLNGLTLTANVVDPAGQTQTVSLQQIGPGRYEGTFAPSGEGAYVIGVGATSDELRVTSEEGGLQTTAGWVLGYSPEYASLDDNPALLAAVAGATGGRVLDAGSVTAVFEHNLAAAPAAQPIWPWLALAATLLLPLDVAARRLTLTRRDWAALWRRVTNDERRATSEEKKEAERAEGMARLLQAKERAGEKAGSGAGEQPVDERQPAADSPLVRERRPPAADERPTINDQLPSPTDQSPEDTLAARLRRRRKL